MTLSSQIQYMSFLQLSDIATIGKAKNIKIMKKELKAIELVEKFGYPMGNGLSFEDKKQCALICVDEMIGKRESGLYIEYLQGVKEEINKLK